MGGSVTGSGMILFRLLLPPPSLVVDTGMRWTAKRAEQMKRLLDPDPLLRPKEA